MKLIVVKNYEEMSAEVARRVARQILMKPDSVLGLATGSTPEGAYADLVKLYREGLISFKNITSFNLDEYVGLSPEHDQSYSYYMYSHLFDHVDAPKERVHILSGVSQDHEKECASYEEAIRSAGGIDLQLLGIGRNGHIGFNEPSDQFSAKTHKVDLVRTTIEDNARFFDKPEDVPTQALSMGMGAILRSKEIILMAAGASKADAIYGMIHGPITPHLPASILQVHPNVVVVVDEAAASRLNG